MEWRWEDCFTFRVHADDAKKGDFGSGDVRDRVAGVTDMVMDTTYRVRCNESIVTMSERLIERILYAAILAMILYHCVNLQDRLKNLEHQTAILDYQKPALNKAIGVAAKDGGVTTEAYLRLVDYFVVELRDRYCIYFTPKAGVKGGASYYCIGNSADMPILYKEDIGQ